MKFSEIKKILEDNNIKDIDCEIAVCVRAAASSEISDEEFDLLCGFVYYVWNDVEKGYTQLIADIVVDLYCNEDYGYRNEKRDRTLSKEQLKECDYDTRIMVENIFFDTYYA